MSQITENFNTNVLEPQVSVASQGFSAKSAPKRRATLIEISTDTSHDYKMKLLNEFKKEIVRPPELSFPKDLSNKPKYAKMEQAIIYKIDRDRI